MAVTRSSRFQTELRAEDIAAIHLNGRPRGTRRQRSQQREETGDAVEEQQQRGGTRKSRAP